MKGDFSRIIFNRSKHYSGVRWQQGRPSTDADSNEAQDIASYRVATETVDVVGQSGAPKHEPGFALSFGVDGSLLIGQGRFYVDGILCENDTQLSYSTQPYLPDPPRLQDLLGNVQIGLVYLDVFKRHVNYQDDASIREIALNGVDTTTRLQTVWQVKALPLESVQLAASAQSTLLDLVDKVSDLDKLIAETTNANDLVTHRRRRRRLQYELERVTTQLGVNCASDFPEWDTLLKPRTGALTVSTIPGGSPSDPCDVPPGGGYTRGENQLYMVQVHSVPTNGGRNGATFKWSRENGSISAGIIAVGSTQSGTASGTVFDVDSVQRDDYLGIHTNDLVEYVDDSHELNGLAGELRRVTNADVNLGRITLDSSLTVDLNRHPKLRKWDQAGTAALAMNTINTPVALENGIQVQFAQGSYRSGDYWQFAARAIDGSIDFPAGPQPAFGVEHHYVRLGLVIIQQQQARIVMDCRNLFPPLTELSADAISFDNSICTMPNTRTVQDAIEQLCAREHSGGTCTITVTPEPTWFEALNQIPEKGDAEICFGVGTYELSEPLVIENRGHLRLHGIGNGSRIIANAESALIFRGCTSVTIVDMAVEARRTTSKNSLMGTITCENCLAVRIDTVTLRCAAATLRSGACLRVNNNVELVSKKLARGLVDIHNCTMLVGHNQIGALITNCARAHIDNTIIRCIDGRSARMKVSRDMGENPELLAELRRTLYSDIREGRSASASRVNLVLSNTVINMRADPRLIGLKFFDQLPGIFSPKRVRDLVTAQQYLNEAVNNVLLKPEIIDRFPEYFAILQQQDEAAFYQGITIGGELAHEISITNTTISDALQGIHIGQSAAGEQRVLSSGSVHIHGNTITSRSTATVNRGAYAILIGNCDSLLIEGNHMERELQKDEQPMFMYAVYASGYFGRRLIVRHNHSQEYNVGVLVDPKNKLPKKNPDLPPEPGVAPLWLVADNLGRVRVTSEWVRVEGNVE